MQFSGERTFAQQPEQVWGKLTDVSFLVQCLPGAENISEAREDRSVCTLRPSLAFVRGTLEITIERTAADRDKKQAAFRIVSKGIGTSSEVASRMELAEQNGGTRVSWQAEVQKLGGLLKAIPQGLIRGAAEKVINDVWESIAAKLNKE